MRVQLRDEVAQSFENLVMPMKQHCRQSDEACNVDPRVYVSIYSLHSLHCVTKCSLFLPIELQNTQEFLVRSWVFGEMQLDRLHDLDSLVEHCSCGMMFRVSEKSTPAEVRGIAFCIVAFKQPSKVFPEPWMAVQRKPNLLQDGLVAYFSAV